MKALVLFGGEGRHWATRWLRPGFRHVAVVVASGDYWIGVDPALGTPLIEVIAGTDQDLAAYYRASGLTVIETETRDTEPVLPFAYANCVGLVKFVLGLRNPWLFTPFKLYRHLAAERVKHEPQLAG